MKDVTQAKDNTCATCKYWGRKYEQTKSGHRDCDCIGMGIAYVSESAYINADAIDDTGLSAVMMTKPTFGCILHSPALIDVEFTSYGMCIITFPDGREATIQGEGASNFEDYLREAEENFEPTEAFPTYEDLEQNLLSAYEVVAEKPDES